MDPLTQYVNRKTPRRLILSQPRPPSSSSLSEDNDAGGDDEDGGGDGFEERGVGGMYSQSLSGQMDFFCSCRATFARMDPLKIPSRDSTLAPELDLLTRAHEQTRKLKNPKR